MGTAAIRPVVGHGGGDWNELPVLTANSTSLAEGWPSALEPKILFKDTAIAELKIRSF